MKKRIFKSHQFIVFCALLIIVNSSCTLLSVRDAGNLVPETVDQDSSLPSLRLNDCTFHLETLGDPANPAILFLHGGAGDYKNFLLFAETYNGSNLTDDYFLIFYDQRGKGLSERFDDPGDITFQLYLEDMEAIIDYFCGSDPIVLIAHSFGGTFTAQYMNSHPTRIAGAVLFEPGTMSTNFRPEQSPFDVTSEWVNDLMWSQSIIGPATHETADFQFAITMSQNFEPGANNRAQSPFWRVGAAAQHWLAIELKNATFDFSTNLDQITPEILFVTGSESTILSTEYQQENMAFFPNARIEVIDGAGHSDLIGIDRDKTVPIVMTYLASLGL